MAYRVLTIVGTRPEIIKMAPILRIFNAHSEFDSRLCVTGQHPDLIGPLLDFFELEPDYEMTLPVGQSRSLNSLLGETISGLDEIIEQDCPDIVLVHGDTTSCLAGALASFQRQIVVAHVEAGLRTHCLSSPFPEEANRLLVDQLATIHFAPTSTAVQNLLEAGVSPERIWMTGSTVVDAMQFALQNNKINDVSRWPEVYGPDVTKAMRERAQPLILITGHRHENLEGRLEFVLRELESLAEKHPEWCFVFPVHLNERVIASAKECVADQRNIHLLPPLNYPDFIKILTLCDLVVTDSGGIQEEAPTLGKPALVTRTDTERPDGLDAGVVLADFTIGGMARQIEHVLEKNRNAPAPPQNIYGDGTAADKTVAALFSILSQRDDLQAAI